MTRKKYFYHVMSVSFLLLLFFSILWLGVHTEANWLVELDRFGNRLLRSTINQELTEWVLRLTNFGGIFYISIFTLAGTGLLLAFKKFRAGIWFLATVIFGSSVLTFYFKGLIMRPRPLDRLIEVGGYSFPSGHSTGATVLYGMIIVLAFMYFKARWKSILVAVVASSLILLIMASRVYLGVHYLSDVLAGLCLGSTTVLLSTVVFKESGE